MRTKRPLASSQAALTVESSACSTRTLDQSERAMERIGVRWMTVCSELSASGRTAAIASMTLRCGSWLARGIMADLAFGRAPG
jgi:hypothetical protein